jgi:hypothetical protein
MSRVAADTGTQPLAGRRSGKLKEFGEQRGSGMVHRRPHPHLDRFQIQTAGLAAAREQDAQKLVYFARDFLADRFGRFFPSGESVSSTGRRRQILRLTSTNAPLKDWSLRNSAISPSALRTAAGEGRFWVAVLPPIFWVS